MSSPVVLITGASGNLGVAVTRAFLQAGARLALLDRHAEKQRQAFPELGAGGEHVLLGDVDFLDEPSVNTAVNEARRRCGRIDVLVHTVGTWRGGRPVPETPLADWDLLWAVNVRSTLLAVRAVLPDMLARRSGSIVTVGARAALAGSAGGAAYSAAKGALLRLHESLAAELQGTGVRVNCVLPSTIDTPANRAAMPNADFKAWVEPAAIADAIVFLASPEARAIHGAAVPVYGGG